MKLGLRSTLTVIIPVVVLLLPSALLGAGGAEEEAGSDRGAYVAEQGRIIQPEEIDIGSYVASVDYGYPDPSGDFGVTLYSGHRQVSTAGQEEIIQVGIQGRRTPFEELPVLNLSFVIDSSGSMSEKDKIEWAKEAFDLFLGRLRRQDILSVVIFSEEAEVLLEATRAENIRDRKGLRDRVHAVLAEGRSNPETGLVAAYAQVQRNYRPQHVNRVLLISDGLGSPEKALEIVQRYQKQGISLSTISVGMNCDLNTMKRLSKKGTGSSRFISNPEKMVEIFSTDLDRMVVPIAYDLALELELTRGTELLGTWGYNHRVSGNTIHYTLPALHHRDYETILVQVRLPPRQVRGRMEIARLKLTYTDRAGAQHTMKPISLSVDYTDSSIAAGGISDPTVLKAGTMLHTAHGLETIGFLYYLSQKTAQGMARINKLSWHATDVPQEGRIETAVASEKMETTAAIRANKQRCLDLAEALKKEIGNTHLRLDEETFPEELAIVRKYIEILGRELRLGAPLISRMLADEEIQAREITGGAHKQLTDLVEELALGLEELPGGSIAFFGFSSGEGEVTSLQFTADRIARTRLSELRDFRFIGEPAVSQALAQLEVSPQSLLDNTIALKVGTALNADYLLVGRIVEMSSSIVVFGKLLDRRSGAVRSVAQALLAKED